MRIVGYFVIVTVLIIIVMLGVASIPSNPSLANGDSKNPAQITATPALAPPYTAPVAWPAIGVIPAFNGFTTASPISRIVPPTDGTDRVFATELWGNIHVLTRQNGEWSPATVFLDIRDRVNYGGEFGLYSIAFPPNYVTSGNFYVKYVNVDANVVISRFSVSPTNPDLADPTSEEIVLVLEQPPYPNHKGGTIEFGSDGMLYIGVGDGGYPYEEPMVVGDPHNNAQNPDSLLGKMVRIDVETNNPLTYTIPADNPFVNTPGYRPEIWLTGIRNPWIFSFDSLNGDLFMGDVGHSMWEEIHVIPGTSAGGENLGWSCYEGDYIYKECPAGTYRRPDWVYRHTDANCAVVGGYVYRGSNNPRMQGLYFYGDLCTGKLYAMRRTNGVWQSNEVGKRELFISFGRDRDGEIYVASSTVAQLIDRGREPLVSPTPNPDTPRLYLPLIRRNPS